MEVYTIGGMNTPLPSPLPSPFKMFRRAIVLSCPLCGGRPSTMRRWLGHHDRCRSCGIRWHREHGFELGPIALNVVITFFTLAVSMVVAFVSTAPDFPVVGLTIGMVAGAIVIPLFAYPFTYLLWQAFDLQSHKPTEQELAEARHTITA
jgi:uncharacterized protein (DUF983 family)